MFGLFTLDKDEGEKVIVIRTGPTSKDLSISANSASKSLLDATCVVWLVEWRMVGKGSTHIDCLHISRCIASARDWGVHGCATVRP